MRYEPLYSSKQIESRYEDIKVSKKQKNAVKEWQKLLDNKVLEKETASYGYFSTMLRDLLGYPEKKINEGRNKHEIEFTISNEENNEIILCIEAKGSASDLFAYQTGYKKHQTDYLSEICTKVTIPLERIRVSN